MKRLIPVCLTVLLAVPWLYAQQGPGAFSTLQTTDTTANSLLVGCAVGSTTCTGGVKAGPISATTFAGTTISGTTISGTTVSGTSATFSTGTTGANLVTTGNTAAGTGNYAGYWLKNDEAVASAGAFIQTSSTYNAAPSNPYDPMNVAASTQVLGPRGGGLILNAENARLRLYTGHTERWGVNTSGDLTVGTSAHIYKSVGTPSISLFGTSPSLAAGSTDSAMFITTGNPGNNGSVTFGHTWTNPPACVGNADQTTVQIASITTTGFQVTLNSLGNGIKLTIICSGY